MGETDGVYMGEIDIEKHFSDQADDYESLMGRLIPQYQQQHLIISELLPGGHGARLKLLDLGCGNGVLSEVALQKMPRLQVTGYDITREMLDAFENTISGYTEDFRAIQGDYRKDTNLGDKYDIVLAGLTLHHLRHEERREFYSKLLDRMNPGALFISRDIIIDEDPQAKEYQYALWKAHMDRQGEDPEYWYEKHQHKDHPVTLSDHLCWLRDAGFVEGACYWRFYNFAITSARKPPVPGSQM